MPRPTPSMLRALADMMEKGEARFGELQVSYGEPGYYDAEPRGRRGGSSFEVEYTMSISTLRGVREDDYSQADDRAKRASVRVESSPNKREYLISISDEMMREAPRASLLSMLNEKFNQAMGTAYRYESEKLFAPSFQLKHVPALPGHQFVAGADFPELTKKGRAYLAGLAKSAGITDHAPPYAPTRATLEHIEREKAAQRKRDEEAERYRKEREAAAQKAKYKRALEFWELLVAVLRVIDRCAWENLDDITKRAMQLEPY